MTTEEAPWDAASRLTSGVIARSRNVSRDRALLARMDPLNPAADWNSASALYTKALSEYAGDNRYTSIEVAVAVSVHLWARNTRAHTLNDHSVHQRLNLGESLYRAACPHGSESVVPPGMSRRFASLTSAKSAGTLYVGLRSVTALIASKGVHIDYPMLAADLSSVFIGGGEIDQNSRTFTKWNRGFWVASPKK